MEMIAVRKLCGVALIAAGLYVTGCKSSNQPAETGLSVSDARAIAKEAYIYGFPMAANYQTMYKQAIDKTSSDYRGAFNTIHSSQSVATPADNSSSHRIRILLIPICGWIFGLSL